MHTSSQNYYCGQFSQNFMNTIRNQFKVKVTQSGKLKRLEAKAFVYKYFVCFWISTLGLGLSLTCPKL